MTRNRSIAAGLLAVMLAMGVGASAEAQEMDGYAHHQHAMMRLHNERARNFHHLFAEHRMHVHEQRARAFTHMRHVHELHAMMRRHHHYGY